MGVAETLYPERTALQRPRQKKKNQAPVRRMLQFPEDAPWPESVNGAELFTDLQKFLSRFMVLPDGAGMTVASWVASTYCMDAFDHHPLLAITSPEMRCGKTRLLELLELVCSRPLRVAGISEAALFRVVEAASPTLLIDEAQMLRQRDERSAALHDLLCASNRRGSVVLRVGGEARDQVIPHSVFCPKVLAAIGDLASVIMDRAIQIRLRRRLPGERVERFLYGTAEPLALPLRQRLRRWALDYQGEVAEAVRYGEPPAFLEDREGENWLSLFAVVFALDAQAIPGLEAAAKILTSGKAEAVTPSPGVQLLSDVHAVLDGKADISTAELLAALHSLDESPWGEWRKGRPLTAVQMARLLKPYNVRPRQLWRAGVNVRGFERQDFEEAFRRYLSHTSVETLDSLEPLGPASRAGSSTGDTEPQASQECSA